MTNYNAVLARNTKNAPKETCSCQTVAFSHYNNLSAQIGVNPETGTLVSTDLKEQTVQCFENIKGIVEGINHVMNDIVKVTIFLTNNDDINVVNAVYKKYFPTYVPARTVMTVSNLPQGALVQVEALVSHGEGTIPNAPQAGDIIKLVNNTINAPVCCLSSQTVSFSHYNNLSAQIGIDPKTGRLVEGGVKAQTIQSLKNIKAILESIDVPLDDVVRATIYVKDLKDMETIDAVYKTFLPDSAIARTVGYMPARTVVVVKDLPMYASVQIEVVVSHGDGTPPQYVEDRHGIVIYANNTTKAPVDELSTQTVAFSHYNHLSMQSPINVETNTMAEGVEAQTKQCLENIKTIVESVKHTVEDIVKVNVFVKDIKDIENIDKAYKEFFGEALPARRVVEVCSLVEGALVQMDAVVSNPAGTPPQK